MSGASGTPNLLDSQRPWECPRCHTINAWWVSRCRCKPPKRWKHDDPKDKIGTGRTW